MMVYPFENMQLSDEEFKHGYMKYQKEDLVGIIFGLKINQEMLN
jgi:hypothetical protein